MSMVKVLGTIPQKWWDDWREGRDWYALETEVGGALAGAVKGTLYAHISNVGVHSGLQQQNTSFQIGEIWRYELVDDRGRENTDRLIALVEELTTNEAEEVIARTNKTDSEHSAAIKSDSGSGNGSRNGSAISGSKNDSGSSNAKDGEKSISSEGISIGPSNDSISNKTEQWDNLNVIGDQGMASMPLKSIQELPETWKRTEFLERIGTKITAIEAEVLENLLRRALLILPEQRL